MCETKKNFYVSYKAISNLLALPILKLALVDTNLCSNSSDGFTNFPSKLRLFIYLCTVNVNNNINFRRKNCRFVVTKIGETI